MTHDHDEARAGGDIHADPWHWLATYADGSQLAEYAEDGSGAHPFAAVLAHHAPLRTLALIPRLAGLAAHVLIVPPHARPVFFRRRAVGVQLDPATPPAPLPQRLTVIGYQWTVGRGRTARNGQTLLALFDDGSSVLTDDRRALDGF